MSDILVVNRVRDFVASLKLTSNVITSTTNNGQTTLEVENVFHARATPDPNRRQVDVDGTKYDVVAVDYENNTVTIDGEPVNPQVYTVDNPFYWHGTPIATGNHIKNLSDPQKVPMIYLRELLTQQKQPPKSNVDTVVQGMRLYLADVANFNDWTREEHYSEAIWPLNKLAAFICDQLYNNGCFYVNEDDTIQQREIPKWGTYLDSKGNIRKFFNENLDAIELTFDLRICQC